MISIAIAVTLIIILLVLRFKSASPKLAPAQTGQGGSQVPNTANASSPVAVSARVGAWSYVAIVVVGVVSGVVAYQFEKSVNKENPPDTQKQMYSSPAPTPIEAPAAAPAPMPNVVRAETLEPEKVNLSGRFQVCLNASCSKFDLWPGAIIISQSAYDDGRKLVLELNETAPNTYSGTFSEEKHPAVNEDMQWTISNLSFSTQNGKISGTGDFKDQFGAVGRITAKKIS